MKNLTCAVSAAELEDLRAVERELAAIHDQWLRFFPVRWAAIIMEARLKVRAEASFEILEALLRLLGNDTDISDGGGHRLRLVNGDIQFAAQALFLSRAEPTVRKLLSTALREAEGKLAAQQGLDAVWRRENAEMLSGTPADSPACVALAARVALTRAKLVELDQAPQWQGFPRPISGLLKVPGIEWNVASNDDGDIASGEHPPAIEAVPKPSESSDPPKQLEEMTDEELLTLASQHRVTMTPEMTRETLIADIFKALAQTSAGKRRARA